jgi:hypothetical protein
MNAASDRPKMQLLEWKRIDKGALVGRATVLLPSGLQISDVGVFTKEGRSGRNCRQKRCVTVMADL